jgi:transglutaminase-like putative cysteine protease
MKLTIQHDTLYQYDHEVRASIQYLRLTPQETERQHVLSWELELPRQARAQRDPFGNILHVLSLDEPHDRLVIGARGQVVIDPEREAEHDSQSPLPYLRSTRLTRCDQAMAEFAASVCPKPDRAGLIRLMQALHQRIVYTPGATSVDTPASEAFANARGVCQDHAHAFIACTRSLGVPARYVSGYLFSGDTQHLASHAWAEAWLDGAWYSFDVTNQLARPERHLKLAVGQDYLDACPVRGMRRGGGFEKMHAQVLVHHSLLEQQQ